MSHMQKIYGMSYASKFTKNDDYNELCPWIPKEVGQQGVSSQVHAGAEPPSPLSGCCWETAEPHHPHQGVDKGRRGVDPWCPCLWLLSWCWLWGDKGLLASIIYQLHFFFSPYGEHSRSQPSIWDGRPRANMGHGKDRCRKWSRRDELALILSWLFHLWYPTWSQTWYRGHLSERNFSEKGLIYSSHIDPADGKKPLRRQHSFLALAFSPQPTVSRFLL